MVNFKTIEDKQMLTSLHPILLMIFFDLVAYAQEKHGVDLTVTQTVSTPKLDKELRRVSSSHSSKIAIDVRTKDIDAFVVDSLIRYINSKLEYKKYHYLSLSGKHRLAYYHIGTAEHLHIAIHSKFALK